MENEKNIVIKIKTTGIDLTPAIEGYVREKINMLEKFFEYYAKESGELIFEVEIGKTTLHHRRGDIFRAEINFNADSAHLRSEAVKDELYAALDEAKDEMSRELRKNKNKHLAFIKRGGATLKKFLRRE